MSLPTGTVVFLMTDIVGSSSLAEADQARYLETIGFHDQVVFQAVTENNGHMLKHRGEGDSTFSVFEFAEDAVKCAVKIHSLLRKQNTLVRSGLHRGEATVMSNDYLGDAVNRCARIRGLAKPDQILISGTVKSACGNSFDLVHFGLHALKGMVTGAEVYEVRTSTGEAEPVAASKLPQLLNRFVGREAELTELEELISDYRLLTLHGPGGIGKTRLAIELVGRVSAKFPGGCEFIDLSGCDAVTFLALLAPVRVRSNLSKRVVVIDNCEQVVESVAAWIQETLAIDREITILATSQIELEIDAEYVFRLEPLVHAGNHSVAVDLLMTRAQERGVPSKVLRPQLKALTKIAERVAGVPLALELVANKLKSMPADRLLASLDEVLTRNLASDSSSRWASVAELCRHTLSLLSPAQCRFAAALSCLGANFCFDAVTSLPSEFIRDEMDASEKLESLVKHSVISPSWGRSGITYHLPHLFRNELRSKLTDADTDTIESALLGWARGTSSLVLASEFPQLDIRPFFDDVVAALDLAISRKDVDTACLLLRAVRKSWLSDEVPQPGLSYTAAVLELTEPDSNERAECSNVLGILLAMSARFAEADEAYESAERLYTRLGNELRATVIRHNRAILQFSQMRYAEADELFRGTVEAALVLKDEGLIISCYAHLAIVSYNLLNEEDALGYTKKLQDFSGKYVEDQQSIVNEARVRFLVVSGRDREAEREFNQLLATGSHLEHDAPLGRLALLRSGILLIQGKDASSRQLVHASMSFLRDQGINPLNHNQALVGWLEGLMPGISAADHGKSVSREDLRQLISSQVLAI